MNTLSKIIMVFYKPDKEWFYFDITWGDSGNQSKGYIWVLPKGVEKKRTGFMRDNKDCIDPDYCDFFAINEKGKYLKFIERNP